MLGVLAFYSTYHARLRTEGFICRICFAVEDCPRVTTGDDGLSMKIAEQRLRMSILLSLEHWSEAV